MTVLAHGRARACALALCLVSTGAFAQSRVVVTSPIFRVRL